MSEPTVRVTRYEVSCLPPDNINAPHFTITVEWRGGGLWAVCRFQQCLSRSGQWSYEPSPSNRSDEWKAMHRFDLETALRFAKVHAPRMRVNGYTVADVLEKDVEQ
ncbi:hypothetical protein BJF79_03855 [Actinomadura sp. CNU-125]|uniref:hypothetical protein n=1 Tax=Actinomadura sp. CNU-125 TaxID=1904961 RepID=UPI00096654DF|nr:hypothetical protein [Actinomadura sp. CNU-125]OLT13044.1 hypothetical protein BJF79_03855 [Actinomadura sp. CNU-125]